MNEKRKRFQKRLDREANEWVMRNHEMEFMEYLRNSEPELFIFLNAVMGMEKQSAKDAVNLSDRKVEEIYAIESGQSVTDGLVF